ACRSGVGWNDIRIATEILPASTQPTNYSKLFNKLGGDMDKPLPTGC
ncbi:MAG: hypothetical protein ACI9KN_001394, partial [Gammaproteobacteria bacterium]